MVLLWDANAIVAYSNSDSSQTLSGADADLAFARREVLVPDSLLYRINTVVYQVDQCLQ